MSLVAVLLWLLSLHSFIIHSCEATCSLDNIDGGVVLKGGSFQIQWNVNYEQESIDIFLSSTDESLLIAGQGYLAFGLSEVSRSSVATNEYSFKPQINFVVAMTYELFV